MQDAGGNGSNELSFMVKSGTNNFPGNGDERNPYKPYNPVKEIVDMKENYKFCKETFCCCMQSAANTQRVNSRAWEVLWNTVPPGHLFICY